MFFIWTEMKEIVSSESTEDIIAIKMKKIALNFYKNFKDYIPIENNPRWLESVGLNSVAIVFKDGSGFMVPHFFFHIIQVYPEVDISNLFIENINWSDLVSNIFDFVGKLTISLTPADIRILLTIIHYKNSELLNKIDILKGSSLFNMKALAKATSLTNKWVSDRLHFMMHNYILYPQFILNPFLVGLKTIILIYDKKYDSQLTYLDPFSLFYLKINFNEIVRVVQLNAGLKDGLKFDFPVKITEINSIHFSLDISGLSPRLEDNFINVPNFNEIIDTRALIEFNDRPNDILKYFLEKLDGDTNYPYLNKLSPERRKSSFFSIVNYLAKYGILQRDFANAAKELNLPTFELIDIFRFMIKNDILAFFPRITYVGIGNRYGLIITDSGDNTSTMDLLYHNLLKIPLCVCFMGLKTIFAYITMPDNYINPFFRHIAITQDIIDIKYSPFVSLKSWGRFSIPFPEGSSIDEFGVKFPRNHKSNAED